MSTKFIALLVVLALLISCGNGFAVPMEFTQKNQIVHQSPAAPVSAFIARPSIYEDSLCAVFARISNPKLDAPALKMGCPAPLTASEVDAVREFLTETILSNTSHTSFGKLRLMDLTGHVSRGEKVQYFELNAMLYNYSRSFATPIIVEMFHANGVFKVKRIKTKACTSKPAYDSEPEYQEPKTQVSRNVGYPKELDAVIEGLLEEQKENAVTPMLPGLEPVGIGGQDLGTSYETPSQLARRLQR